MEYFFNEKFWFVKIVQSLWNSDEERWDLLNETSLEWETRGEVGYLKTQIVAWNEGSTEKTEWTYNEQNLGEDFLLAKRIGNMRVKNFTATQVHFRTPLIWKCMNMTRLIGLK